MGGSADAAGVAGHPGWAPPVNRPAHPFVIAEEHTSSACAFGNSAGHAPENARNTPRRDPGRARVLVVPDAGVDEMRPSY